MNILGLKLNDVIRLFQYSIRSAYSLFQIYKRPHSEDQPNEQAGKLIYISIV